MKRLKSRARAAYEGLSVLTELLDLVTELKFALFISARDKKIGLKGERSTEIILSKYFNANGLFQFKYKVTELCRTEALEVFEGFNHAARNLTQY